MSTSLPLHSPLQLAPNKYVRSHSARSSWNLSISVASLGATNELCCVGASTSALISVRADRDRFEVLDVRPLAALEQSLR